MKKGYFDLPLHNGDAPSWLFKRMEKLARYLSLAIIEFFGIEEYLKRLSDPIWFQSFGCLLGFDWHSSGLTTTTTGAIISGLSSESKNLGLFFAGGKGARALDTPSQIDRIFEDGFISLDLANSMKKTSRLVAKIDSSCIQDGYKLYHHFVIFDKDGNWAIIQQGMKETTRYARRYHWNSFGLKSFVKDPHKGVITVKFEAPLNLVDSTIEKTQQKMVELANDKNLSKEIKSIKFPAHHPIYEDDFDKEHLSKIFSYVSELNPKDFEELLLIKGLGEKSLRALALSSHLLFGSPLSYKDPATFSFAHGGKDGYPYPVMRGTYDKTIQVFETAIRKAKLSELEKERLLSKLRSLVI
ncbi:MULTISPECIES: DUF763 domain-containing protein [Caldisericum]|uniref:DUF763 domain-containing protein n=1 Tax=Caldisericum TaxID=693074 RepID=UPI0039FD3966